MSNFVGFNISKEDDAALLRLAGQRQVTTGERVDKSMLLREAVSGYLAMQDASVDLAKERHDLVAAIFDGQMTFIEADAAIERFERRACIAQRAFDESEWSKDANSS